MTKNEKEKNLRELISLDYAKAERDFGHFFKSAWPILEPGTDLKHNWHHDLIAEYLTACYLRQIRRLVINIPPRYGKSTLTTIAFPAWVWIQDPSIRFLVASYSMSLSSKHSVDRRALIESPWYQAKWGDKFKMSSDQNVKTEFQNDKRGHMIATSLGGTVTGKGGNFLLIDDPHDVVKAESQKERDNDIQAFDLKLSTRLDDKMEGVIIVIMQRLHEKDLTGHLEDVGGWEILRVPCEAEEKHTFTFPMSGKTLTREPGDILHEEREDQEHLDEVKREMGAYGYSGQYQQSPAPRLGGIWKRHHWQRWDRQPETEAMTMMIHSWDTNIKEAGGSFVVGQIWGKQGANYYLFDQVRGKWGFTQLLNEFRNLSRKWPMVIRKLVENKANGAALQDALKTEIDGIVLVEPQGGKEVRAMAVEPLVEAGNVWLPSEKVGYDWTQGFIDEAASFPKGANDDQVDTASQALIFLSRDLPIAYGGKERGKKRGTRV